MARQRGKGAADNLQQNASTTTMPAASEGQMDVNNDKNEEARTHNILADQDVSTSGNADDWFHV